MLTAGLTAFYTFRAYFLTFWGEERIPQEAGHHAHESPPLMTMPLVILAVFAVGVGPSWPCRRGMFGRFLEGGSRPCVEASERGMNYGLMALSGLIALGGIGLAW